MKHDKETLKRIAGRFQIDGEFVDAEPYGTGHINDTYKCKWQDRAGTRPFILQRINNNVFKNPPQLMENISRVTGYLGEQLARTPGSEPDRETLTLIPTRAGEKFHLDEQGNFWRTYVFIRGARTFDTCTSPDQAYEGAKMVGKFQRMLDGLPGPRLHDTIPFFHHTPRRFKDLEKAIEKDAHNRAASARAEIKFAVRHKPLSTLVVDLLAAGRMPERITHNDTKVNNVMIDDATGRGICVIDLDTVMAGCALFDFGDMVRTMPRLAAEDERDLGKVSCDPVFFEAMARGYLESARQFLLPVELEHLVDAGRLITFTIGIRFLADYLAGDVYFKTHRPGHNLDRARVQFKFMESLEQQEDKLEAIILKHSH